MHIQQKRVLNIEAIVDSLPKDLEKIRISYQPKNKIEELEKIGFPSASPRDGETILPAIVGPISRFNVQGKYIVRKDLPKETRVVRERLWRYQPWGRGQWREEVVYDERECYQRDFIAPPAEEFVFNNECIISRIISLQEKEELKHFINLFLEFFGECTVIKADLSEIIPMIKVNWESADWEFLPEGESLWEKVERHITHLGIKKDDATGFPIFERQRFISSLGPVKVMRGLAGFRSYLAYIFEDLTALESVRYGNAIYIFDRNWEELSKLTKAEIISEDLHKARVVHWNDWKEKLKKVLNK